MARSVKKIETTVIDLASLRQDQVAWLIGTSPAWVRARAHLFERELLRAISKMDSALTIRTARK